MFLNDSDIYRTLNETFLQGFYNCSRKILKVCSRSVLEQSKVNSRTVLEQIIRTFLELFWNHSTDVLELFRDIYRTLNGTFYEGCSTIVPEKF